jgi:hypothetical protein
MREFAARCAPAPAGFARCAAGDGVLASFDRFSHECVDARSSRFLQIGPF